MVKLVRQFIRDIWNAVTNIPVRIIQNWIRFLQNPLAIFDPPDVFGGSLFPRIWRPFANAVEMLMGPLDDFADGITRAILNFIIGAGELLRADWPDDWNTRVVKQNDAGTFFITVLAREAVDTLQGPEELGALLNTEALVSRFGGFRKLFKALSGLEKLWKFIVDKLVKRVGRFVIALTLAGTAIGVMVFASRIARRLARQETIWPTLRQTKRRSPRRIRGRTREKVSQIR